MPYVNCKFVTVALMKSKGGETVERDIQHHLLPVVDDSDILSRDAKDLTAFNKLFLPQLSPAIVVP